VRYSRKMANKEKEEKEENIRVGNTCEAQQQQLEWGEGRKDGRKKMRVLCKAARAVGVSTN